LALGALVTAGVACKPGEQAGAVAEKKAAAQAPVKITVAKVTTSTVQPRLEVTGTLDPDEKSELAAQTAGSVLAVHVDLGTRVKKGDLLVELDGREASLRLDAANATTSSQRARLGLKGSEKFDADAVPDVKAAKDAADLAKTEHERARSLYQVARRYEDPRTLRRLDRRKADRPGRVRDHRACRGRDPARRPPAIEVRGPGGRRGRGGHRQRRRADGGGLR
jgi:multidrug efflux pump subunit AcrA (membrane-fusion protein)